MGAFTGTIKRYALEDFMAAAEEDAKQAKGCEQDGGGGPNLTPCEQNVTNPGGSSGDDVDINQPGGDGQNSGDSGTGGGGDGWDGSLPDGSDGMGFGLDESAQSCRYLGKYITGCDGDNSNKMHSFSSCDGPDKNNGNKATYYNLYDCDGGGTNSNKGSISSKVNLNCGGSGAVAIEPVPFEDLAMTLGLSIAETDWLNSNCDKKNEIHQFVNSYVDTNGLPIPPILDYAKEVAEAFANDDFTSLYDNEIFTQDVYQIWKNISQAERDLIKEFTFEAYGVFENRRVAENETFLRFGNNGLNDKSDAFRHAYYNILNTKRVGIDKSKLFADAHESEVPSALIKEKQMDLFNNNVGQQALNGNSDKSNAELANIIYQKLLNGELRYLSPLDSNGLPTSNTQLIPTNQ